jgi:hypothetical protein
MKEEMSLDKKTIREIAKKLILAPDTLEFDKRNLVHEISKGDYDNHIKDIARSVRDKANEAASLTIENWQTTTKRKG